MDMKTVVCVLLLGMCISTSGSPDEPPNGYCRIVWLIGMPCDGVNSVIVEQINLLPHYQLITASAGEVKSKHTYKTEVQLVNVKMRPAFMGQGCHMEGTSVSLSWENLADNANDYCNLMSLTQRSGLSKAPGFLEFANEWLCPGYKQYTCA